MNDPMITVLMPVYNCEKYIHESVLSILNQTYNDFEFLIIDDASTDRTVEIIKTFEDLRIKLIVKPQNTGYTNSLNYGLRIAKGKYIARMDGDDISMPNRFEKQVAFLEKNDDVLLCGSPFSIIGTNNVINVPESYESIKLAMLKNCCIGHPTVMMRKDSLLEFSLFYDVAREPAEDYDLWIKLLSRGKIYNLQEVLLRYRVHDSQVSQKRQDKQTKISTDIKLNLLIERCDNVSAEEINVLRKIIGHDQIIYFDEIKQFQRAKEKLQISNNNLFFDSKGFYEHLNYLEKYAVRNYFLKRRMYTPSVYIQYLKSKRKLDYRFTYGQEFKLLFKSIIFWKNKWNF